MPVYKRALADKFITSYEQITDFIDRNVSVGGL